MNSEIGNKLQKSVKLSLCRTYRHICEDDVYMHSFFTSATLDTN